MFMGMLRQKSENHIESRESVNDLESGFTGDRRITDNIYMVKYCGDESYKKKNELIVTSLEFRKALDSVDQKSLITALMAYNIQCKIIDIITKIYTDDNTNLLLDENKQHLT